MRRENLIMRMTESADLCMEPVPGVPVVEIGGDRRVLIENHQGLTEYDRDRIQVKVKYGAVCVTGDQLELASMTNAQVVIKGMIHGVQLIRGG